MGESLRRQISRPGIAPTAYYGEARAVTQTKWRGEAVSNFRWYPPAAARYIKANVENVVAIRPLRKSGGQKCCDAQREISIHDVVGCDILGVRGST